MGNTFFPTQRQEKSLGYDVKIESTVKTIFFQFKVPEKKTTSNGKYWPSFEGPYYEFKIWPKDITPQHNKLVELANLDPHNNVFYCSPCFHTFKEFKENYCQRTIAKNSIYVPCKNLPQIYENDKHNICYTLKPKRKFEMHSDVFDVDAFDIDEFIVDIENTPTYKNLHECLINISEKFSIDVRNIHNDYIKLYYRIAEYLFMNENLFMILLAE